MLISNITYNIKLSGYVIPYHSDDKLQMDFIVENDAIESGELEKFILGISDSLCIKIRVDRRIYDASSKDNYKWLSGIMKRKIDNGELKIHILVSGDEDEDKEYDIYDIKCILVDLLKHYTECLTALKKRYSSI